MNFNAHWVKPFQLRLDFSIAVIGGSGAKAQEYQTKLQANCVLASRPLVVSLSERAGGPGGPDQSTSCVAVATFPHFYSSHISAIFSLNLSGWWFQRL